MDPRDPLARSIRALTIAVWVLAALIAAQLALTVAAYFRPQLFAPEVSEMQASPEAASVLAAENAHPDNDFSALPPEQKVERATVILLVQNQVDGERVKAVITEVIKQKPGTRFYQKVGDEFHMLSQIHKAGEEYGDGQVVFLTGNPAEMRASYSYSDGRIGSFGQMTLEGFREMVQRSN